jgi:hypothetical protein
MTDMTAIVNSVHTYNESLHRRCLPLSVLPRTESECSEQGYMTDMTPTLNSVHMSNDSL